MRPNATARKSFRLAAALLLGLAALSGGAGPAPDAKPPAAAAVPESTAEWVAEQGAALGRRFSAWYRATPPTDRIVWGALAASAGLAGLTLVERSTRVRRGRVVPKAFRERFRARLAEGKLDWAKGLDYCELNPSPASRVALAALRRWGRPAPDLDRAVALARQAESDRLRRHVGTLRRVAALAPLIGLLGSLLATSRGLAGLPAGAAWGPVVAGALAPLTAGVGLAILALVAYDGLMGRVETLGGELDRIGAEVVDAVAPSAAAPAVASSPARVDRTSSSGAHVRSEPASRPRAPHTGRVEIPERFARDLDRDAEV